MTLFQFVVLYSTPGMVRVKISSLPVPPKAISVNDGRGLTGDRHSENSI